MMPPGSSHKRVGRSSAIFRVIAAAALALLIAAGIAALRHGSGATAQDSSATSRATPPASSLFAVFRSSARGPDGAPADKLSASRLDQINRAVPPAADIKPAYTRLADTANGHDVYLLAGDERVCAVITESSGAGSSGCTFLGDAADPARPPVDVTELGGDRYSVTVLVRDGIRDIQLTTAAGDSQALSIRRNTASAVVRAAPTRLTWLMPDGSTGSLGF